MIQVLQYLIYLLILVVLAIPLGTYIRKVMNGEKTVLSIGLKPVEKGIYRLLKVNDTEEVRDIIEACTQGKLLGILGEETVNVLEVNLMLDGILEK